MPMSWALRTASSARSGGRSAIAGVIPVKVKPVCPFEDLAPIEVAVLGKCNCSVPRS